MVPAHDIGPWIRQVVPDSAGVAAADTGAVGGLIEPLVPDLSGGLPAPDALVRQASDLVASFLPRLIGALVVLVVLYGLYRFVLHVLRRLLHRSGRVDAGVASLSVKTFRIVAWTVIGMMVAAQFGIDVTALLAGLSIAGLALGFAARDTLENFIAGMTILIDRPFRIGDQIEVDDTFGVVHEITLRSTRLRTLNDQIMIMPNSIMINHKVLNHTLGDSLRIEIPFGIAYREYPAEARAAVLRLTEGDDRLDPARPPSVVVTRMGESSVDMVLRMHIRNPKDEVPLRFEYVEKVREGLREARIEIPFPHLQLFIDGAKGLQPQAPDAP